MNLKIYRIKKENLESVFLTFYFAVSPISKLLEKIWIPRPVTYIAMLLACAVYIINRYQLRKLKLDVFIAFMILAPITFFGVLFHHADFNSANEMYAMIIIFFPAYFIMRAADTDQLIRALRASAYIGIAIYLPNAFLVENIRAQYMTYAYDILFPLSIIVYYALAEKRRFDIAIAIAGTILLAVFGCRGALIALALFFVFINIGKHTIRDVIVLLLLLALLFWAYQNLTAIVIWLKQYGISSYALTRIANNQALTSYSRIDLYEYIYTKLLPNNYLGYGPLGNRVLMPVIRNKLQPYPHQLFFELLLDYGFVIGGLFSVAVITVTAYLLIKSKGNYRYLTGLFCIICLFPLMVSGSFYANGTVPFIFALYMKCREQKLKSERIKERT